MAELIDPQVYRQYNMVVYWSLLIEFHEIKLLAPRSKYDSSPTGNENHIYLEGYPLHTRLIMSVSLVLKTVTKNWTFLIYFVYNVMYLAAEGEIKTYCIISPTLAMVMVKTNICRTFIRANIIFHHIQLLFTRLVMLRRNPPGIYRKILSGECSHKYSNLASAMIYSDRRVCHHFLVGYLIAFFR